MAMSPALRKSVLAAAAGGAIAIMGVYLPGPNGVEGTIHTPIRDVGGHWTVCTGHDGPDIIPGKYYSDAECAALLNKDLVPVQREVDGDVKVPIDEYMRAALYSMAFNIGIGAFRKSSMLRDVNAGNTAKARQDMMKWVDVNGKPNQGLINRREIDVALSEMGQK